MAITGSQKAYRYALSGVMRSGTSRSNYTSGAVFISIGGQQLAYHKVPGQTGIALDSLTITDNLDEEPNRCTFRVIQGVPTPGQEVIITLGSINNGERLFAGHVLTAEEGLGLKPDQVRTNVSCVDYTWQLGFQKVTKRYTGQPGAAIAQDLIATAAVNGFTSTGVDPTLAALEEITFTNEDLPQALTRLARRTGAFWYVDYRKNVHMFYTELRNGNPTTLTTAHPSLSVDGFAQTRDLSQGLTRVYVEGRGSRLLSNVASGDTLLPLDAVDMFAVYADVFLKASFQGSEGGAQHLDFTGVIPGGAGAIVGPGIGPSSLVTLTAQAGAGVTTGVHDYAVTFVTASGESLPSPTARITTGQVTNPPVAPGVTQSPTHNFNGSNIPIGRSVSFVYTYSTGSTPSTSAPQTLPSAPSVSLVTISNQDPLNPSMSAPITIAIPYSTDPRVTWIQSYARDSVTTGATYVAYKFSANNSAGGTAYHSSAGAGIAPANPVAPTSNTTAANQIAVSAIPVGAASVTQRKLYRTAAGAAQLKLLTTIANNTATTYLDVLADASLGANVPATDTSGLTQPAGSVFPGATAIPIAGTSAFQASGGWAIIGNGEQVIRYTGLTAGALTGIPAAGVGAITAAVNYNSTITAAPMLTGVPATGARAITRALTAGDEMYLVVQVDDPTAQTTLATALGGNGIREEWVQDRRLSIAEARARGQATIWTRPLDHVTLRYQCRDVLTAAGKPIVIALGFPININTTLTIQQVTIDNFRPRPPQLPTYTVTASSSRFSFENWLRRFRTWE